jgi:hypothetical protein
MPPSPSLFKGVDHVYPFAVVPLVGARIACRFLSSQAQDLHLKKNISAGDTWSRQPKRRSKRRGNEASLSRRTAAPWRCGSAICGAASQIAQHKAMNQLAGFNGQIKSKDDVTVQYQLFTTGQSTPVVQNSLQQAPQLC